MIHTYNALYNIIYIYFARTFNQNQCIVTKYCTFSTAFYSETLEWTNCLRFSKIFIFILTYSQDWQMAQQYHHSVSLAVFLCFFHTVWPVTCVHFTTHYDEKCWGTGLLACWSLQCFLCPSIKSHLKDCSLLVLFHIETFDGHYLAETSG